MNVSIRYAKALFQIAKQQNKIDAIMQELKDIDSMFSYNEKLKEFFFDKLVSKAKKISIITTLVDKLKLSKEVKNLLIVLVNGGREGILNDIIIDYEQMYNDYKGIVKAEVYTAYDMAQDELNNLKTSIKALFNKEPVINIKKDPSIIGGLKLKVGWTIYDGTIKTHLKDFAYSIKL
jgi:F-type H+-transporting ATPase subunit delta